jgi:hypothetical protein
MGPWKNRREVRISAWFLYNAVMLLTKELLHTTDAHLKKLKANGIETTLDFL